MCIRHKNRSALRASNICQAFCIIAVVRNPVVVVLELGTSLRLRLIKTGSKKCHNKKIEVK